MDATAERILRRRGLDPGEIVTLMGASGAGTSTLVRILWGAFSPDRGPIAAERRASRTRCRRTAGTVAVCKVIDRVACRS